MKKLTFLFLLSATIFAGCNGSKSKSATSGTDSSAKGHDASIYKPIATINGISLSYFIQTQEFADASLKMLKPENPIKTTGSTLFQYEVKNFKLTDQTPGAPGCNCNNSSKGQHIHQILNGAPYVARYKDTFYTELKEGHYINLSFLSRSFHESVKNKNAFVLSQFNVGKEKALDVDLSGPLMFYSRPKGEYKGQDTKNILLDFYLVNTELATDGNKIRATINGAEFILTKWAAYAISGLPMGENTIKLELIDKDNKPIAGPFNSVERKIKLSA